MKEILEKYLKTLKSKFQTGKTTEVSFYSVLEELFKELLQFGKIKGTVICNPQKTEIGFPDFIVNGEHGSKIGYIEAKDLFADLNEASKTEQLKRYTESLPNLILTNYLEFWLYRDHKKIKTVKIIEESEFEKKIRFTIGDLTEIQDIFDSFFSFSIKNIYKAKELATELAKRTRLLKINTKEILDVESEEEKGLLYGTFKAFKEHLISDLKIDDFSDMYAQTITYGLFLAKLNSEGDFDRTLAHRYIPESISLLYDMFRNLAEEDLPKALVWNVEDITNVLNNADISNIRKEIYYHTQAQDPIIHFYETFLAQYDAKLRKQRGVYYTPESVVSFIVRSINTLLKEEFDKPLGLADSDVKILDPACGTATFLASVIEAVYQEIIHAGRKGLLRDIIKNHVLEDVYGFELMMAPYAVAHLKLSLLLKEFGYEITEDERFKIYLTNTLESKKAHIIYLPFYESLTKESAEAQKVKEETPILVVLANPPYSVSSFNKSEFIENLMEDYKKDVKGERNIQPLSDDYIKFIRFAQWKIEQGGKGIFAYISNNSYLSGLIHRGMRKSLIDCFDEIYILNLHGNSRIGETCPDGSKDENVFDIQQGVAIGIFVKTSPQPSTDQEKGEIKRNLFYSDLWGLRENKNNWLLQNDTKTIKWEKLTPKSPQYFFVPKDFDKESKYQKFLSITQIFGVYTSGVKTHDDKNLVKFKTDGNKFDKPYAYKPFDARIIEYDLNKVVRHRFDVMRHFLHDNLGLCIMRMYNLPKPYAHFFLTKHISDTRIFLSNRGASYIFPLYLLQYKVENKLFEGKPSERTPNLNLDFVKDLTLALSSGGEGEGEIHHTPAISPEQIFFYCYGIMHSETYRKDYEEFLKIDFPRIPFTKDYNLFLEISKIGKEIGKLHLLESPLLDSPIADYPIEGEHLVKKPAYNKKTQKLYINDEQYFGNMPEAVWEFVIGGYQVLDKYLKYRKNRNLSREEIEHLLKVITAIKFTIDKMKIADELFKKIDLNNLVTFDTK
jgi:predicted helicase